MRISDWSSDVCSSDLVRAMPTTEAAIRTTLLADLYAVIGDADGQGGWTVRVYHEPLVPWIWLGCLLMVAGGLTSLSDRRLRVGEIGRASCRERVCQSV